MTEQTDAAEVGVLADLIAKAHPFWSDKARGLHVCIAKDVLASDWLAAREAAARAEALREAADALDDHSDCSCEDDDHLTVLASADWLRNRADSIARTDGAGS